MKIAVVHDWLVTYAGAERVLEQILQCFPQADLFAVVDFIPPQERAFLLNKTSHTTFIQKLPWAKTRYRSYLPLMPLAIEQLDVSQYDLVISSCHAVSKGVLTGPDQLHLSYIHSPMRYAYDLQHQYLSESGLDRSPQGWIARYLLHRLRKWDIRTANGVDFFIANSQFIARRVYKTYRREAKVIYPPVDVHFFQEGSIPREDFYLALGRMVPYKRMDLIVEAFTAMSDKKLLVIGSGPDLQKVKSKAKGQVEFLGFQSIERVRDYLQRARAFIFMAEEDFGISMVEAQASGTPVIAFAKGGALEIVRGLEYSRPTGVWVEEQTVAALQKAIRVFESQKERFSSQVCQSDCRENALRFSQERFREQFMNFVEKKWQEFSIEKNGRKVCELG